jgi:transcription initiation factor TFIIF subunit alpha
MTTTEILRKITTKKTGLSKDQLMPLLVSVLKRINPHKQKVKGTMYLSLKTGK